MLLTRREFMSAFRESSVVLYSVLLPLLLYPFLLWLMVSAMTYLEGQRERHVFVVVYDPKLKLGPAEGWLKSLERQERVRLLASDDPQTKKIRHDVVLRADPKGGENALVLEYVSDRMESESAAEKMKDLVGEFNEKARRDWLKAHNLEPDLVKPFELRSVSRAASGEVGGYLLGSLLPIGLLVMIALGGAYPAIDTTAGERERGTWETLAVCGPSLGRIVFSKYLFVSLVCSLSGLLNLFAMLVSIRSIVAPLLRDSSEVTFNVTGTTMLVMVTGVVAVSFFISAALLLCAVFARTFREGQALTTPMFMLIALPVLPLSDPALEMSTRWGFVPLVNLALVWRQALQGDYQPLHIVQTGLVLLLLIGLCLAIGVRLLANEQLMSGSGIELTPRSLMKTWKRAVGGR